MCGGGCDRFVMVVVAAGTVLPAVGAALVFFCETVKHPIHSHSALFTKSSNSPSILLINPKDIYIHQRRGSCKPSATRVVQVNSPP